MTAAEVKDAMQALESVAAVIRKIDGLPAARAGFRVSQARLFLVNHLRTLPDYVEPNPLRDSWVSGWRIANALPPAPCEPVPPPI